MSEAAHHSSFVLNGDLQNQHLCYACVKIPAVFVNELYEQTAQDQQRKISISGFSKGSVPLSYIKKHYRKNLLEQLKELLFKYIVIDSLYDNIQKHKILVASEPRLHDVQVEEGNDASFTFELSLSNPIQFKEWRSFPFKAPKRKNYKDIDRQVENFIEQEEELHKTYDNECVQVGDWVYFSIAILDHHQKDLFKNYKEHLWINIGNEEADVAFQAMFLHKKVGDQFCTFDSCLQEYFSTMLETHYQFLITVLGIIPHHYFCFEQFKHQFKLKNNKDVHQKLIEVFSFRNDISQRRSTIEDALKLLLSKHHIDVPNHLILRQQKLVLESVKNNPDYQVYKGQKNFKETIKLLAAKQVKEIILIDQLSYSENIPLHEDDVKSYLNLTKRPRTKEFLYFTPPPTKIQGQEMPIPLSLINKACLREKTLNHVIYHLTRKK